MKKNFPSFLSFFPPFFLSTLSTVTSNPPDGGRGERERGGRGGRGREREHPSQRREVLIRERERKEERACFFDSCWLLVM